ncbi:hypothetical protein ACFL08_02190 [Patescibacteria group bacterium]
MKKRILTILGIIFFVAGCSGPGPDMSQDESDFKWSLATSPITGKCYEVVTIKEVASQSSYGYMGMAEISCDYLNQTIENSNKEVGENQGAPYGYGYAGYFSSNYNKIKEGRE